jgi:hypothetical protein
MANGRCVGKWCGKVGAGGPPIFSGSKKSVRRLQIFLSPSHRVPPASTTGRAGSRRHIPHAVRVGAHLFPHGILAPTDRSRGERGNFKYRMAPSRRSATAEITAETVESSRAGCGIPARPRLRLRASSARRRAQCSLRIPLMQDAVANFDHAIGNFGSSRVRRLMAFNPLPYLAVFRSLPICLLR